MKCDRKHMLLYTVTDRTWLYNKTLAMQVEEALKGGSTCIQLREKELNDQDFLRESFVIKELCKQYGVPFIINDNVEVAIKCNADGIHVGQHDMAADKVRQKIGKDKILGVSVHTVEQAILAEQNDADYLGVGSVFSTSTKLDAGVLTYETLKEICDAVNIPVVAIGGINADNKVKLTGSGIDGVAVESAIFAQDDIECAARELLALSKQMVYK